MPFYSELFKRLSDFEVSPNLLWIAGVSFIVAFVFMMREFFSWMVKQNEVRRELAEIKNELSDLRELIKEAKTAAPTETNAPQPAFPLIIRESQNSSLEN